jgi:hypothetical protein
MGSGVHAPPISPGQRRTAAPPLPEARNRKPEGDCGDRHAFFWFLNSGFWFPCPGGAFTMKAIKPIERLVLVSYTHCCASTPSLSTWWSSTALKGELVSRGVSRLDAFSGYPVRTWLPCCATGVTTGPLEVRPSRSSRTKDRSSQFSYTYGR